MGKALLEFQPNRGDVLPSHKVIALNCTNLLSFFKKNYLLESLVTSSKTGFDTMS